MAKHVVELYDILNLAGIIVYGKTDVMYTNQAGGTTCAQPAMEGAFVPMQVTSLREFRNHWNWLWNGYTEEHVQSILEDMGLANDVAPITLDERDWAPFRPSDGWGEAWIPVTVRADTNNPALKSFRHHFGVIVYTNSD